MGKCTVYKVFNVCLLLLLLLLSFTEVIDKSIPKMGSNKATEMSIDDSREILWYGIHTWE